MSNKTKIILVVVGLTIAFASGRYSVSSATIEKTADTKTDTAIDVDKDKHKETTIVTETAPGGGTKTTTKIVEDTETKKHTDQNTVTHTVESVTPAKTSKLNVSGLAAIDFSSREPVYGVSISKEFIGPVTAGAFGLSNGILGVSLGINF